MDTGSLITSFLAAVGVGAIVGLERQAARHEDVTVGVRSFGLYALWGTASGFLGSHYGTGAFVAGTVVFGALVIASYLGHSTTTGDWGTTTEVAALATYLAGVLVWLDEIVVALAVAVGTAAVLRAKAPLRALIERFSDEDVRATLQFGVITAIVLPLVPDQDYGPFDAFNPREIWLVVVLVSAIGLAGYVALRVAGPRGLGLTGLLGGLVSSTAVTLGFSRMSHEDETLRRPLAIGILAASAVMYPRVLAEAWIVAPELGRRLTVPLLGLGLLVAVVAFTALRTPAGGTVDESGVRLANPLTLSSALGFAALYGAVIFTSKALIDRVSTASLSAVGAVTGINDVDAITLSMGNLVRDGLDTAVAARVVIIAVAVNALVKAGLAAVLGSRGLRRHVLVGLLPAAIAGFLLWLLL